MKGEVLSKGYYKNPEKTSEAFDSDGWFLTGDVVMVYENGSVKIIDRCKNIFKTSQGEYIAPEKVENIYTLAGSIGQCFVYGDSLKNSVVAVIVPEEAWAREWATANGVEGDFAALCQNAQLKAAI